MAACAADAVTTPFPTVSVLLQVREVDVDDEH
jgi:hypothetical protein